MVPKDLKPAFPEPIRGDGVRAKLLEILGMDVVPGPADVSFTAIDTTDDQEGIRRTKVTYRNSLGEDVPGIIMLPTVAPPDPLPGVVCIPGTGGGGRGGRRRLRAHAARRPGARVWEGAGPQGLRDDVDIDQGVPWSAGTSWELGTGGQVPRGVRPSPDGHYRPQAAPTPRPSRRSRQASQTGPLPTNALLGAELGEIRLITTLIPRGDPGSADFRTWLYLTKTQNKFTPLNLPLRGGSADLRTAPIHNPKRIRPLSSSPCEGEVLTFNLHLTTTQNRFTPSQAPPARGKC